MATRRNHGNRNSFSNNMADTEDITLTQEEVQRLNVAFQDKNFLKLFQDYVDNINSEESKQKYEEEIILLEKERGYDVKFIHPVPGYVIKFVSITSKIFVNICKNECAEKATNEKTDGGTQWKIPVILSKPRDDIDKKGTKCRVYDVVFHPDTIELAQKDSRFRGIVEDTAFSMISEKFGITLNAKEAKYPKIKYKGKPPHVVLRRVIGSKKVAATCEPLEEYWKKHFVSNSMEAKVKTLIPPITPKYVVKYRDIVDMKDFSLMGYTDKCAPKEIIIEIILPGVKKASDIELDVFERKLSLKSGQNLNHNYVLNLDLSYAVNSNDSKATFEKLSNKLTVQLPLKDRGIPTFPS